MGRSALFLLVSYYGGKRKGKSALPIKGKFALSPCYSLLPSHTQQQHFPTLDPGVTALIIPTAQAADSSQGIVILCPPAVIIASPAPCPPPCGDPGRWPDGGWGNQSHCRSLCAPRSIDCCDCCNSYNCCNRDPLRSGDHCELGVLSPPPVLIVVVGLAEGGVTNPCCPPPPPLRQSWLLAQRRVGRPIPLPFFLRPTL